MGPVTVLAGALGLPDAPDALGDALWAMAVRARATRLAAVGTTPERDEQARAAAVGLIDAATGAQRDDLLRNPAAGGWLDAWNRRDVASPLLLSRLQDLLWVATVPDDRPVVRCPPTGVPRMLTGAATVIAPSASEPDGVRLVLPRVGPWELNGIDPLLNAGSGHGLPLLAGTEDAAPWTDVLGAARDLVARCLPREAMLADSIIRCLVPLRQDDGGAVGLPAHEIRSGTESFGFGAHALSLGRGAPWEVAKIVLHEMHHGIVNALLDDGRLLTRGPHPHVHWSPWKRTHRPISAIVHAVVAFWSETELLVALDAHRERAGVHADATLDALLLVRLAELAPACETALASDELAPDGVALVTAVRDRMSSGAFPRRPRRRNTARGVDRLLAAWDAAPATEFDDPMPASALPAGGSAADWTAAIRAPSDRRFLAGLEPGVRSLVAACVGPLGAVTYTSCEGHDERGAGTRPSQRMVGLLPRDQAELRRLSTLLIGATRRAVEAWTWPACVPRVSVGHLDDGGAGWLTIDLELERADEASWDDYFGQLDEATDALIGELGGVPRSRAVEHRAATLR